MTRHARRLATPFSSIALLLVGLGAVPGLAAGPPYHFEDDTEYSYNAPRPVGAFSDFAVERPFPGQVLSLQATLVAGRADDIGYVGDLLVTNVPGRCVDVSTVLAPVDITSQITVENNLARFTLRAQENCCCATGWGHLTQPDRADAKVHWVVELDSLLETLDPHGSLIDDGAITSDPARLATGGSPVRGAAADGSTRILLRYNADVTGQLELAIESGNLVADGGLSANGLSRQASITVPVVETPAGFQGFAVYRVPEAFDTDGAPTLGERDVAIRLRFTPTTGTPKEFTVPFRLVRPPVVLIHGLWSSADTWEAFPLRFEPRFELVKLADYRDTAARPFAVNQDVPRHFILSALNEMKRLGWAATKADVAGHSMGGILARFHVQSAGYLASRNYYEGDVHRLVTLDTPHTGSPLADLLVFLRSHPQLGPVVLLATDALGIPIDEGAIDDLGKFSPALFAIGTTAVPSHALFGIWQFGPCPPPTLLVGPPGDPDQLPLPTENLRLLFRWLSLVPVTFEDLQNDVVVGRRSQEGGIAPLATSCVDGPESIHFQNTSSPQYADLVGRAFAQPALSNRFGQFPAVASLFPFGVVSRSSSLGQSLTPRQLVAGGISLASPADGATFGAGDFVPVEVTTGHGFGPDKTLVVVRGKAALLENGELATAMGLPPELHGELTMTAFAIDAAGDVAVSEPVTIHVESRLGLLAVQALDRAPLLLGVGDSEHLLVTGTFGDLRERDITLASFGTTYTSSNPAVVTVSADGLLTATGEGTATVQIANSGELFLPEFPPGDLGPPAPDEIPVTVSSLSEESNHPPVAVAGADQAFDCAGPATAVELDGSASTDPDGDPLTFQWTGPFGEVDAATASVLLPVGVSTVTLTVSDGRGGTASDSREITVADAAGPVITTLAAQPAQLWPPNHKMVAVTVAAAAADVCSAAGACTIVGVTSNEEITGDVVLTGPLSLQLRAERLGAGAGRSYWLEVVCTDALGNPTSGTATVRVAHDQGQ